MIRVEHVTKRIGEKVLVEDLTFDVYQGEIFGFIGPSGSGKTSTIRLLTGVYGPTEGWIRVMGLAPDHPSRVMQERFGYMPQLFVLYPNLTVRENLNFVASLYGMSPFRRGRRVSQLLRFVELWDARNTLAANVSGGMQRRIELAAALLHDPPLLFVDEPTAGIDPVLRSKFWEEFRRLRGEGRTIFVTTQYVGESEHCDRVGVIRKGRLIAVDRPVELRRKAFGGDMVDLEADNLTPAVVHGLLQPEFVKNVIPVSRTQLRVSVREAGGAIPALLNILESNKCSVSRIEEYRPSFDEVFVELMKRDAEERGEDSGSAETA
jgi:ABC-2 type transport system ATP-binding protein